jgi:ATP-dependent helicase/nuclease subunit B
MLFSNDSFAEIPAVNIHLSNGKTISLKGRIDRVDEFVGPDGKRYKRAVDYKKSSHDLNRDAVEKGYQLQLMTYLLALKDADPSCVPAGALYQHVHDPVIETDSTNEEEVRGEIIKKIRLNGLVLDDNTVKTANGESVSSSGRSSKKLESLAAAEMDKTIESVRDSLKRHLENIYEGHIEIEPVQIVNTSPCKYCDHKTICGFDPRLPGGCVKDIYGNTVQETPY